MEKEPIKRKEEMRIVMFPDTTIKIYGKVGQIVKWSHEWEEDAPGVGGEEQK